MLRKIANQTQIDWIRDVSELEFWKIESFYKNDGNHTYYVLR